VKYFFPFSVLGFAIILFLSCANNSLKYPNEDDWFQYGEMTYKGQKYKTIKIGEQTWMAENLNYEAEGEGKCYEDKKANCDKYGRLYDWKTAQEVCPDAWHLPSHNEWETLMATVGSPTGIRLKADSVWNEDYNNGTNTVGFAALPGGKSSHDGGFSSVGEYSGWWTSNESYTSDTKLSYIWTISFKNGDASWGGSSKLDLFSVRCLKND